MDAGHLRHHLDELRSTLNWLRSLTPDGPRYKLWLGDLVEFTRVTFGPDSDEAARVRGVLTEQVAAGPASDEAERTRRYLERLHRFAAVLRDFDRSLAGAVPLFERDPRRDGAPLAEAGGPPFTPHSDEP